jgi:dihydroneopterin aldolase
MSTALIEGDGDTDMNTRRTISYETVLDAVRQWPPDRRFALVQDVLSTLAPKVLSPQPKPKTLEKALGLLATSQPAPSDAEIKQWLDEHRIAES